MNKKGLLVLALVLFLFIAPVNLMPSSLPATIVTEPNIKEDFAISADGDESASSITSFSETLDDDLMLYPDSEWMNYMVYSDAQAGTTDSGSLESTKANDGTDWSITNNGATASVDFFFLGAGVIGGLTLNTLTIDVSVVATSVYTVYGYNYTLADWNLLDTHSGGSGDYTFVIDLSTSASSYLSLNSSGIYNVHIRLTQTAVTTPATTRDLDLDYADLSVIMDLVPDYAESFVDVSDWTVETGNILTTDGDVMSAHLPDDNAWDSYITNSPSIANVLGYYCEARWKNNISGYGALWYMYGYTQDSGAGTGYLLTDSNKETQTTYTTSKWWINDNYALESIRLYAKNYGSGDRAIMLDFLQISPPTQTGWQHDCSTTLGVVVGAGSGGTISADGDYISLSADADGSTFDFFMDTTATQVKLNPSYYQFIGMKFHADDVGNSIRVQYYTTGYADLQSQTTVSQVMRWNLRALTSSDVLKLRIWVYTSQTIRLDLCKAYSIANFTIAQGGCETSDYLYVDSNALICTINSEAIEYIQINYDPTISVSENIFNLTLSNSNPTSNTDFEFIYKTVYSAGTRTFASDEWRGDDLTYGGDWIDCGVTFWYANTLSAIKFIEDATAPSIVRSSATPNDPDDDEAITLSAVVTDAVEVYTVKFNAITCPGGFSDVDYSATEIQSNLWTYEFTTLTAGYYVFLITASDGANENAGTEWSYIEITVRETAGILKLDSPLGFEWDDTYLNIWCDPNLASTLYIYDNSSSKASGSVPAAGATVRYELDNTEGLHDLDLKLTDGVTTIWRNDTYYSVTAKWSNLAVVGYVATGTVQSVLGYTWANPLNGTTIFWETEEESGNITSDINGRISVTLNSASYAAGSYTFQVWTTATSDRWIVPFTVQQLGFTSATFNRLSSYESMITITGASYSDQLYDIYVADGETSTTWLQVADNVPAPAVVTLDVDNSNQRGWKIIAVSRTTEGNYIQSSEFTNDYQPGPMPITEDRGGGGSYNLWTDPMSWVILVGIIMVGAIAATVRGPGKGGDEIPNVR